MPRPARTLTILAPAAGLLALGVAPAPQPPAPAAPPATDPLADELDQRFWNDVEPLLAAHCYDCHGADRQKGGVRFDQILSIADALAMADQLATARHLLEDRQMPPEERPQPTEHEVLTVQQWIDDALAYYPPDAPVDPGWFTIHRLNRAEYRNTLRDLLGVDPAHHDLAAALPPDDTGYGFDNIAAVLSVSPLALEAYLDAAERALDLGLGPVVQPSTEHHPVPRLSVTGGGRALDGPGFMLYSNGAVVGQIDVPVPGEYEIGVTAWGTKGGDELPRMSVRVDGREVDACFIDAERSRPETETMRVRLGAGRQQIAAHFTNDFYQPNVADRNLAIESITLAGPVDEAGIERPAAYTEVFASKPRVDTPAARRDAARANIAAFAARAFRRPPTTPEINNLLALYARACKDGDSDEQAARLALTAVLVSPAFLYRSVDNPRANDPGATYRLSAYEMASRLSYFLWSSTPDRALLDAAARDELTTDEQLTTQVRRMLADPKSQAFVENFAGQWLLLRNLDRLAIDQKRFPDYSSSLREAMITEATMLFAEVVREDRPVTDLIESDHTFVNKPLAALYGFAELARENGFQRVQLPEGSPRGGVLTTAAVLTVTSNPSRTSPVKRGLYVLDQILGTPPPPPPPDIPRLENSAEKVGEHASLRDQLNAHLTDATCASCHRRMDPIGLSLENFDAIGRWRDADESGPIDASGTLPSGTTFAGPTQLKQILLAREGLFVENLTRKLLTYALGRGPEPFDRPAVNRIVQRARANDDRLSAIIEGIVLSDAFRTCRGTEPKP